jgi:NADPH:quinone reductase-like Zn-dependent oxidoreductase
VRALAISGKGEAPAIQDVAPVEPADGQVRVAVGAASVNGMDAYVAAGYVWDAMPHRFPVVLGRDFAGTVDAVGPGVEGVAVGDRVVGVISAMDLYTGALAEQVVVNADTVAEVPDDLTLEQATSVALAGASALSLVDGLDLTDADTVLVAGATGGVGTLAVQLAARTGATVIATGRPERAEDLRRLGASAVVDPGGDLPAQVADAAPAGVTAVGQAAGDASTFGALVVAGGRLTTLTGATSAQVGRDDVRVIPVNAGTTPEKLRRLLGLVASGSLEIRVAATYALSDAAEAVAAFGRPKLGKVVVTVP